jgi:hypothetical protein
MFQPQKNQQLVAVLSTTIIIFHFAAERELHTFSMQMVNTAEEPEKREEITWSEGAWLLSPVVVVAGHD